MAVEDDVKMVSLKVKEDLKQRHYFADKGPYNQSYGFYSRHVGM